MVEREVDLNLVISSLYYNNPEEWENTSTAVIQPKATGMSWLLEATMVCGLSGRTKI